MPRSYTEQKREGVWEEVAEVMPDCRELSERGECPIRSGDFLHLGMRQWRLVLVMEWDGGEWVWWECRGAEVVAGTR